MGKDSKLNVNGVWVVLAFIVLLILFALNEAEALELEAGPTILSGEYAEGGSMLVTERFGEGNVYGRWAVGFGYVSKQYCHCNWPADLEENNLFQLQRVIDYERAELGIGMAYFTNTNRALGKNMTWSLSLGWRFNDHWTMRVRHYSNAGSGSPNLGQDMLTLGYKF